MNPTMDNKEGSINEGIECPICSEESPDFFAKKNACNLYRCRQCGFIFVSPIPGNLSEIYTEDYFAGAKKGSGYVDYEGEKEVMKSTIETYLDEIEKLAPGRGRLFEIGAATGTFLEAASRRGWRVSGVEISEYAAEKARAKGLDVRTGILEDLEFGGAQFDVVAMWDVLEHLPNPAATLKLANSLLKPGGLIALNTPNAGSFFAKLMGKRWHLIVPPEHLSYFGVDNLTKLLGKTGMSVRRVTCLGKKFTLQYVFKMLATWYKFSVLQWIAKKTQTNSLGKLALSINLRDNLFLIAEKNI
jgi:2-polyprenyl-3-methyl-5-hydroxy-6-metoxy-1,4-benzoquinol methylase